MEKDWVRIYSCGQTYQAELIRQYLADHNIESVVLNKQDSSYNSFGDIELYVSRDAALRARNLLKTEGLE